MQITEQDRQEIRQVISRQIDAMQRGDYITAFACASLFIQEEFRTPQKFMEMVQTAYAPVYKHRSLLFEDLVELQGIPTQPALILTESGKLVRAYYLMYRQADANWKINGCILATVTETTP
ncbi:MAG: DUF4864 domain-containing protein [Pseudanabaenaceae cyanobacterium]